MDSKVGSSLMLALQKKLHEVCFKTDRATADLSAAPAAPGIVNFQMQIQQLSEAKSILAFFQDDDSSSTVEDIESKIGE